MRTRSVCAVGLSCAVIIWGSVAVTIAAEFTAPQLEFFESQVRPILVNRCYECHSSKSAEPKGGLRLDSREAILKGGETGAAAVPSEPTKSLLIDAIHYGDYKMPPKSKLPAAEVATLTKWVEQGLPWPKETTAGVNLTKSQLNIAERKQQHWAWYPVQAPAIPAVKNQAWPRGTVDRFLLAKMEAQGLSPAPATDRATLLRRIYFDVLGLPPTPGEVQAFCNDNSPDTVGKVVDSLLARPQFGERWARHWLDLVRYADSRGHEFDYLIPNAYQYRDYVIRALNADVPHDQFVIEQIAGDLLTTPRLRPGTDSNESILGTGFWFLGEWVHSPVDIRKDETDRHDNMLDVMGKTFLGLTIGCARCHDHKFDAIGQADYYALAGFTLSSAYRQVAFESLEHNRRIAVELAAGRERAAKFAAKDLSQALEVASNQIKPLLLATLENSTGETSGKPEPGAAEEKLTALRKEVAAAENDARHPLHLWAKLCRVTDAAARRAIVEKYQAAQAESERQLVAARESADLVVDYRWSAPDDFYADGFLFGSGPQRVGTLTWDPQAESPIIGLVTRTAVIADPAFHGIADDKGTERDGGALGGAMRAGRTCKTKTFTIQHGAVQCLLQGEGTIYACVDSHAMIHGPLHGQLIRGFNSKGKSQWLRLNLKDYIGHRVHLEFTPKSEADFRVLAVAQGEQPPSALGEGPLVLPEELLAAANQSAEELAGAYQAFFQRSRTQFAEMRSSDNDSRCETAAVAVDWLLRQLQRNGDERLAKANLSRELAEQLAGLAKLQEGIQRTSRTAPAMWEGSGVDEHILKRGNPRMIGDAAPRRFLEALDGGKPMPITQGSGRLALAKRIVDPANPFTARVIVNRVWQHLFGRGIVATVDNFGVLGERPTHPELLDDLAAGFVQDQWSLKRLIKRLILSSAYQQSSQPSPAAREHDPQNLLLSHAALRRLEGEAIRDAILTASGRLNAEVGGPTVPVFLTHFLEGRGRPASGPLDGHGRRSVYLATRRNFLSPFLLAFDTPIPFNTMGRRNVSNVPAQSLILLNDPFVIEQSNVWARKIAATSGTLDERVTQAYLTAFARAPTAAEQGAAAEFFTAQGAEYQLTPSAATNDVRVWTDFIHVLFNVKEFIYLQ